MGTYDPLRPQVIGPQWSPVRQESIPLDLSTEIGYTFTVTGSGGSLSEPRTADYVLSHFPTTLVRGQTPFVSIYRRGEETLVGQPYRTTIIPSSVSVTGATLSGTSSAFDAVVDPSDDQFIQLGAGTSNILAFFDIAGTSFANALRGRRILKVNLLYTASGPFSEYDNTNNGVYATLESLSDIWSFGLGSIYGPLSERDTSTISRLSLGDVNPFWNGGVSPYTYSDRYPWRYEELNRMSVSTPLSTRFGVGIRAQSLPLTVYPVRVGFIALEVIFCEESRLWYGGNAMGRLSTSTAAFDQYNNQNTINLRNTSLQVTGGLSAGDYVATITLADAGDEYNRGDKPQVSGLRQAEAMPAPGNQGILVTKWQDPEGISEPLVSAGSVSPQYFFAGDGPTSESYDVLPAIGLHNSQLGSNSLDITAPHSYYIQVRAFVLDNTTATQEIVNNANATQVFYPWIRFYARRFGDASRTLLVRLTTGIPAQATITQDAFDALPEIVDGWREVTLRFDSVTPSFSNTNALSVVEWSTTNGSVNMKNRWEILGAQTFIAATLNDTYGQTFANASFNNLSLPTGTEQQYTDADIMVMLSQDPPAVSGLAVSVASQAVSGIGLECATSPECVPTGIGYHNVTWSGGQTVCDTFTRAVTGTWGTADSGQTYTNTGNAGDYAIDGDDGTHYIFSGTGSRRSSISGVSISNGDLFTGFKLNVLPVGDSIDVGFLARSTDNSNQYSIGARVTTAGAIQAVIQRIVAGAFTTLAAVTVSNLSFSTDQLYFIRVQLDGSTIRVRIWEDGSVEPTIWHATVTDTTYTSGSVGIRTSVMSGYTGTYPVIISYSDFTAANAVSVGTRYELQRRDAVDTTWRTIMESNGFCTTVFKDYESRVGVQSDYRIRALNALDFEGPWSTTVSSTLTGPGVYGADDGNSVLIFTTNEIQDGSSNLAYTMVWESSVTEEFSFPESDAVQLQTMYQRDYAVAFRPTERGGERFSRILLVNNAAVSTGRIRDGFRSLRDMAWEDVSYVCVRNELGDRWFAAVIVPGGTVMRNRRLYLARVDVIEVTDTPSIVTPEV